MGGHPGTLTTALCGINSCTGLAPVGLGLAACTHPFDAHEPQAMIAFAPSAVSLRILRKVSPPTVQYTPPSLVGALPSTASTYSPGYSFMMRLRISSTWKPAAACRVSS